MVVLPTPGSPIITGLFFFFLANICATLLIESSLPITGSILPSDALLVTSMEKLSNIGVSALLFTFLGFVGLAIPDFMIALIAMYLFFVWFDFSPGGLFSPEYVGVPWSWGRVKDLIDHIWIPMVVLGTAGTASLMRITRANLLDELSKPYVITARAKGLSEWRLILKYPVRLALNPAISLTAYILPYLISGSIIVGVVLSLPTVGPMLVKALVAQDMFLAGGIILLIGFMTVIGTFISDILLLLVDPRIRLEGN